MQTLRFAQTTPSIVSRISRFVCVVCFFFSFHFICKYQNCTLLLFFFHLQLFKMHFFSFFFICNIEVSTLFSFFFICNYSKCTRSSLFHLQTLKLHADLPLLSLCFFFISFYLQNIEICTDSSRNVSFRLQILKLARYGSR